MSTHAYSATPSYVGAGYAAPPPQQAVISSASAASSTPLSSSPAVYSPAIPSIHQPRAQQQLQQQQYQQQSFYAQQAPQHYASPYAPQQHYSQHAQHPSLQLSYQPYGAQTMYAQPQQHPAQLMSPHSAPLHHHSHSYPIPQPHHATAHHPSYAPFVSPAHPPAAHTPQPVHHAHALSSSLPTSASVPDALSATHPPATPVKSASQVVQSTPSASAAKGKCPPLSQLFSDLDSRFLVNLPDEELASFERIMFQLQQAHWFYLDFFADRWHSLPKFSFKMFCETVFKHIPSFAAHLSKFDAVYKSFNSYLNAVPVCGCILVNPEMTHVVMVRSWEGNSWSFPRGKLDANEDEITCAIREVDEEIGFDCRAWFKGYEIAGAAPALTRQDSSSSTASSSSAALQALQPSYIEGMSSSKAIRLYFVLNVPNDSQFVTKTRKEIGQIGWVPVSALPGSKHGGSNNSKYHFGNTMTMFAAKIRGFMKKLKAGEISGYGPYDQGTQPQAQAAADQQQQQPQSGKKAKAQAAEPNSAPKSGRKKDGNKGSFSSGPQQLADPGGWSAEAMFAANKKLGVVQTVQEEKLQLPAHLDAKLDELLGRRPASQQSAKKPPKPKQSPNVGPAPAPELPASVANAAPLPSASKKNNNTPQKKPHVPAPELDFAPRPYVNFDAKEAQQQPQQQPQQPGVAAVLSDLTTPSGKGKKQQQRKKAASEVPAEATGAATPLRVTSILQRSTGAPVGPTSVPAAAASTTEPAGGFRFDLSSIPI